MASRKIGGGTRAVSLRNFPKSVHRKLKARAGETGTTVEKLMAKAAAKYLGIDLKEEGEEDGANL